MQLERAAGSLHQGNLLGFYRDATTLSINSGDTEEETCLENNKFVDVDFSGADIVSNSCQIFVNVLDHDLSGVT